MAKGPRYKVKLRRRREEKTDYKQRLNLIKSGKPRLVIRTQSKKTIAQIIKYKTDGDQTLISGTSIELKNLGYKGNPGNVPAAYLTGLLCAMKAQKEGVKNAILDISLETRSGRIFAALQGAVDAGLTIPHGEINVPQEMLTGKHIAEWSKKAEKPQFNKYKKRGLNPEKIEEHVEKIKNKIMEKYK